ncbi:squalene/phytoene synthase family protein [Pelagovum pacificum]|uniref:Phytoene synthase n=1 Tax=Pelagovum pacificum TaxID=2588711 RepID=A0A5C5GFJ2_9RHOB|nr:squalene/phytoene synthase family protein [Pelagovum pacificum]QQA44571.1 squalene/phytoene synthase family protein [Pelagovum pacificum]TNY32316.1 phytoene synthase [Pelagovum pacificum]
MSLAACAGVVERGDPDRFLAAMSCPPTAREALFPLYAFNVEIARAPHVTEEPMIAEMRLQWWRDALEEISDGKPPRAHEVVGPLAELIRTRDLPVSLLDDAADARRWDIWKDPFEDEAAFEAHIGRTAGHLAWVSALALGADSDQEEAVRDGAYAGGIAAWLQAIPALEARGLKPLPDGRPEAVRALAASALERLKAVPRRLPEPATFALRPAWQAEVLLKQAMADPSRVAAGTLGQSEFRRRGSLALRAARGR